MKSAAWNDDQTRSPAAERLRRRNNEIRTIIIMEQPYKGALEIRQRNPDAQREIRRRGVFIQHARSVVEIDVGQLSRRDA